MRGNVRRRGDALEDQTELARDVRERRVDPDCAGTIQEPAGYSVAPTLNAFSAIFTSNDDNRNRAASSASCPVSLSRKTGPEPETLPTANVGAVTGLSEAETIFSSSMRLASRP